MLLAHKTTESFRATVELKCGGLSGKCYSLLLDKERLSGPYPRSIRHWEFGLNPGPFGGRPEIKALVEGQMPAAVFADWAEEVGLGDEDLWDVLRGDR